MKRINKILCVIISEENCKPALERAVTLAENNQASLTVINIIEKISKAIDLLEIDETSAELQTMLMSDHEQQILSLVEPYRKKIQIHAKILKGIPFLEIVREVLRCKYDLVVKMTGSQDWMDRLFSSDDMHLLRKCPCPIWLIKPETSNACRRILAAVDVNDDYPSSELQTRQALNQTILEMAGSLALSESSQIAEERTARQVQDSESIAVIIGSTAARSASGISAAETMSWISRK